MEQKKDYSLLRPFDLEAAKRGDAICYKKGSPATYISGPNRHGTVIMQLQDDQFAMSHTDRIRMAPLCWVEGRPVYKGDKLWSKVVPGLVYIADQFEGELLISNGSTNGNCEESINLTWTPPKVKREGWMNIYASSTSMPYYRGSSPIYFCKQDADDISRPDRIACIRIEWEE